MKSYNSSCFNLLKSPEGQKATADCPRTERWVVLPQQPLEEREEGGMHIRRILYVLLMRIRNRDIWAPAEDNSTAARPRYELSSKLIHYRSLPGSAMSQSPFQTGFPTHSEGLNPLLIVTKARESALGPQIISEDIPLIYRISL